MVMEIYKIYKYENMDKYKNVFISTFRSHQHIINNKNIKINRY